MHRHILLFVLAFVLGALAHPSNPMCKEVNIPVSASMPRFIMNATVENNWDAVSLSFNFTRRDSGTPVAPLPIAGMTNGSVKGDYTVAAELCGSGSSVLVLTHGIIESRLYWHPNFANSEKYDFVKAAVAAGYSVLNYDRIGVGASSKVDALNEAQFQIETAVLDALVTYAQEVMAAHKVALLGHSYGAYLSAASANHTTVNAVILSGFSGNFSYFAPFVAGSSWRVAAQQDPARWGHLDAAYLTSADVYAETYAYFREPFFEHRVAEWTFEVANEPFAVGELPSLLATYDNFNGVKAPVFALQGQFDVSACGGNCENTGFFTESALRQNVFGAVEVLKVVGDMPSGHNLNLHKRAPEAFQMMFDFLKAQGV